MVTKFKTPPFIATLAMMTMARGAALLYTKGQNIYQIKDYTIFGQGNLMGIPIPIIFLVLTLIITWYILNHTVSDVLFMQWVEMKKQQMLQASTLIE